MMTKAMTCVSLVAQLGGYLRGTLVAQQRTHCEAHLAECALCRAHLALLQTNGKRLTCNEVARQIGLYEAEAISIANWPSFIAHLESCPGCWNRFISDAPAPPARPQVQQRQLWAGHARPAYTSTSFDCQ